MEHSTNTVNIQLRHRLSLRLSLALLLVALLSVLGLAFMEYQAERDVLKEQLIRQLTSIVDLKEQEIDIWLEERRADVRMLAVNELNQDHVTIAINPETDPEFQTYLTTFLNDNLYSMQQSRRGYLEVAIVGLDGIVIASADPAAVGTPTVHDIALAETLAAPDGEYIQDIHLDPNTDIISMAFGHVLYGIDFETGEEMSTPIGAVLTIVSMEETIYPLISAWPGLGETGETLLVRAEGEETLFLNNLRFDDDAALNLRVPTSSANAIPAHMGSRGQDGAIETPDYRGVPVVAAYRHIDQIGWGLVAKQNVDELFAPIRELGYRTVYYTSVILILVGIFAIFVSHNLTQPLRNLVGVADRVAEGDLILPPASRRHDEIGTLTGAVRTMVGALQQRRRESEFATRILRQLNATSDVHEVISGILDAIRELTGCETVCILTFQPNDDYFTVAAVNQPKPGFGRGTTIQMAGASFSADIRAGRIHFSPRLTDEAEFALEARLLELGYGSRLTVPLSVNKGAIGALNLAWLEPNGFDESQLDWLEQVADTIALAFERSQLFSEMNEKVAERTRELAEANERLKQLDKLKSKFVSDVSHELRTPLTNLKLYLSLVEQSKKEEKRRKYMGVLDSQANRLEQLIADILDLSRLEVDKEKTAFGPVDLNELLGQVVSMQEARAVAKGLALSFAFDEDLPLLCGDSNQLLQVLTNLVANAINYTPAGSILARTRRLDGGAEAIAIEVIDTGMGIEAQDLPHLFDRFYRGRRKDGPEIPGTGLGLGIAREIVESHGGRINVVSEVGVGSTFTVIFPAESLARLEEELI